jgi:Flp pilus assembly protein TadG
MKMIGCLLRFTRDNHGGALVELAVVIPILALLIIGVVDFGHAYMTSSIIAHSAAAGAQYGSQNTAKAADSVGIRLAARQDAADLDTVVVTSTETCDCNGGAQIDCSTGACGTVPRAFVTVTVSKTFRFILDYPALPDSIVMTRAATLRVQ